MNYYMLLFIIFCVNRSPGLVEQHQNHVGDTKEGRWEEKGSRKTRHKPPKAAKIGTVTPQISGVFFFFFFIRLKFGINNLVYFLTNTQILIVFYKSLMYNSFTLLHAKIY